MPSTASPSRDEIPKTALLLGLGGLIPFVVLTAGIWLLDDGSAALATKALVAYAAVILSFMGGVHWGVATVYRAPPGDTVSSADPTARLFIVSVLPALVAWPAALLAPPLAFAVFAAAFLSLLVFDLTMVRLRLLPGWYAKLRVVLTAVVVLCLGMAALQGWR